MSATIQDIAAQPSEATQQIGAEASETGLVGSPKSCCGPSEQAACCEPAAKPSCCGSAPAGSCGCR